MDEQRRSAIITLLRTRDDGLPEPRRRGEAAAGFAGGVDAKGHALRSVSCTDCLANGLTTFFACETCGGSGLIPDAGKDPMDDPIKNPPYDPRRKSQWGGNDRIDAARERDRTLARLDEQLAPPKSEADLLAEANRRGYDWERERERMYAQFDYVALDAALEQLRDRDEAAYHSLHSVYVYAWLTELSPAAEEAIERGLVFLNEILPTPLRAPEPHPAVIRIEKRLARSREDKAA